MPNDFGYSCPQCGETDELDVEARIMVRLTRDGTDADQAREGDHVWDDDSLATCGCGWEGKVRDLTKA